MHRVSEMVTYEEFREEMLKNLGKHYHLVKMRSENREGFSHRCWIGSN